MEAIDVRLHIEPEPPRVTHQQHRVSAAKDGKPRFFDSPALRSARSLFTALLSRQAPETPLEGPLKLTTVWFFKTPAGGRDGWKTTRPDTDNLQKLLKDCLTRCGYWIDDAQVCDDHVQKFQEGESAWHGIAIRIETLEPPDEY